MSTSGESVSGAPAGSYAQATASLLRHTVLSAADRLLTEQPWSAVTMAQVADAAGVSRQTLYNVFGNRQELAIAYAVWAGDQLLDEVERCVAEHADDLPEALVAAFTVFLDAGANHPLVRSLVESSGDDLLGALRTSGDDPIVAGAVLRLTDIVSSTWTGLPGDAVVMASEVLVRLAISHLLQPTGTSEQAARQVGLVLSPFIEQLQATSASS